MIRRRGQVSSCGRYRTDSRPGPAVHRHHGVYQRYGDQAIGIIYPLSYLALTITAHTPTNVPNPESVISDRTATSNG